MTYITYSCGHAQKDSLYFTDVHGKSMDESFNKLVPNSFKYVKFVNDDVFERFSTVWLLKKFRAKFTAAATRCAVLRVLYIASDTISLFVHTYRVLTPEKKVPRLEHFEERFIISSTPCARLLLVLVLFVGMLCVAAPQLLANNNNNNESNTCAINNLLLVLL